MELYLVREESGPDETLGILTLGSDSWYTLERPWIYTSKGPCGTKGVSCITAGDYALVPHNSEAHANVWALVSPEDWVYHWDSDIPPLQLDVARTTVLIHPANWVTELRGCIAIGKTRIQQPNGVWMIQQSRAAVDELREAIGSNDNLVLHIGYKNKDAA